MLSRKVVWLLLLVVATVGLAVVLGIGAGNLLAERKEHDAKKMRAAFTQQILQQMEHVQIGDTLPNATLLDLERNTRRLHSMLSDKSLIIFFDYSCENCLVELEYLGKVVKDSILASNIILISATNPLFLLDARNEFGLKCPILYDDRQQFMNALGVDTYPFNLFVGSDGVIDSVVASAMGQSDLDQFLAALSTPYR